jgi:hypothetical protein
MPWFKIDDKAHSHPKFMRAGNAALGLWLRCGSYSAQHLTEGIVPGPIAQMYGTAPQAAKLVKTGLWHGTGHDCDRCPQPAPGDYVIHDFFEAGRNTTRAQYEANKKNAVDRAAKSRAGRKAEGFADDSSSKADRFEDESKTNRPRNEPHFSGSTAGQEGLSQRTPADGVTTPHAAAMPYPSTSYGSTAAAAGPRDPLALDTLADLKRAIAAAGLRGIGWDLQASQIEYASQAINRVGIDAMVIHALTSAQSKGQPASASAWIRGWRSLEPDAPPGFGGLPATAGPNVHQIRPGTDSKVAGWLALVSGEENQ